MEKLMKLAGLLARKGAGKRDGLLESSLLDLYFEYRDKLKPKDKSRVETLIGQLDYPTKYVY